MSLTEFSALGWHEGEHEMHLLLKVPEDPNPTWSGLTPYGERILNKAPLLAVGTLDDHGRPWTSLWGGEAGFARSLGQSVVGLRIAVDGEHDPVLRLLTSAREEATDIAALRGKQISALSIDLATRSRVKISGEIIAGVVERAGSGENGNQAPEAQIVFAVKQSLGNCPKYLNIKQITSAVPSPKLSVRSLPLSKEALDLIAKADLFFVTSHYHGTLGTNHRGGPPGFVRVLQNDSAAVVLVYPEYSGNRLYQTLGNLKIHPQAGVIIPDFETGDALYFTSKTQIIIGKGALDLLPRSNMVVKFTLTDARLVTSGLAFRGKDGTPSPYNPTVRYLDSERRRLDAVAGDGTVVNATLVAKTIVTPTIARLRFEMDDARLAKHRRPGQYAIFDMSNELGLGYSHMRNDDPQSLNDDFVRSFTVSSPSKDSLPKDEFEITMRNVGKATDFLFRQHVRHRIEIPIKGFAGDFHIEGPTDGLLPFVAGGIGITPLLAHLSEVDTTSLRLFWSLNVQDLGLVEDTFSTWPKLPKSSLLFITGSATNNERHRLEALKRQGAEIFERRLQASDLVSNQSLSKKWYICTGKSMRNCLLDWLAGRTVIYEDFDY